MPAQTVVEAVGWAVMLGAVLTTTTALVEVTRALHVPFTNTVYVPASSVDEVPMESVAALAFGMAMPSFSHWYVTPVPVAPMLKLMGDPAQTIVEAVGCVVMLGKALTTTIAFVEVTVGEQVPLTATEYVPASLDAEEAMA